jgi:hypothetical protein
MRMKVQDRIEIVKLCKRKNTNPPYIDDLRGIESCVPYGNAIRENLCVSAMQTF